MRTGRGAPSRGERAECDKRSTINRKIFRFHKDRDGDGLEDWFEKKVQDISLNHSDDPDGDDTLCLRSRNMDFLLPA